MTGILIQGDGRPDIAFDNGTLYGGLHCGECFGMFFNKWICVRLEYSEDWYLICEDKVYSVSYGVRVRKDDLVSSV